MHRLIALAMLCAPVLTAGDAYCRSALAKIQTLEQGTARRGSVIVFSLQEINSWAYYMVPQTVPQGIRNQKVTLGTTERSNSRGSSLDVPVGARLFIAFSAATRPPAAATYT